MISALYPDPSEIDGMEPVPVAPAADEESPVSSPPGKVTRQLLSGTSALGLGIMIERGSSFAANILAARLGGAATFGAYSLAITTANNIATYAGAGIGSTAARFSGKYQYGCSNYGTLARVLAMVSILSAAAASLGLWLGAVPIARLLGQTSLVGLLRWAALSAAGIIVLECARGFFVGQRRLAALVLMSLIVGVGMLTLLPLAATRHSPVRMITSQGAITTAAVLACILLARPLGLFSPASKESHRPFGSILREVWGFGFVQLAGLVGSNAAGWWLTTLVARADGSLVQMGFFGIASQLRNIVGLAPGLLTEGSFAVMADPEGESSHTPHHVLAWTTFASSIISFSLASFGILLAPWLLRLLYTSAYSHATVTVAVALALAVMHMGNAPAAARLSIVSIRMVAIINTVWAIVVAVAGTLVMADGGSAATAMAIYLAAHGISSALVLIVLARKDSLPAGLTATFTIATLGAVVLAGIAALRANHPVNTAVLTIVMLLVMFITFVALFTIGRHYRWIPTRAAMARLALYSKSSIQRVLRRPSHAG